MPDKEELKALKKLAKAQVKAAKKEPSSPMENSFTPSALAGQPPAERSSAERSADAA
jgi:hypothetical protein